MYFYIVLVRLIGLINVEHCVFRIILFFGTIITRLLLKKPNSGQRSVVLPLKLHFSAVRVVSPNTVLVIEILLASLTAYEIPLSICIVPSSFTNENYLYKYKSRSRHKQQKNCQTDQTKRNNILPPLL